MALREALGDKALGVHRQLDEFLRGEDALVILMDGNRTVSHAQGFAASPCQLELLTLEIEKVARRILGTPSLAERADERKVA